MATVANQGKTRWMINDESFSPDKRIEVRTLDHALKVLRRSKRRLRRPENNLCRTNSLKCWVKSFPNPEFFMPKKIRVEADICAPKPVPPNGYTITTGHGQKVSLERGSHTRSKKNPGKRPSKGG